MRLTRLPKRLQGMVDEAVSTIGNPAVECSVPPKYNNRKVEYDGKRFDSAAERDHYIVLRLRQQAGEILNLRCQPKYELQSGLRRRHGGGRRAINYLPDFDYYENGQLVAVDVKGARTAVFNIKEKLFREKYPDVRLEIVKVERKRRR